MQFFNLFNILLHLFTINIVHINSQLVVNVKNNGGEVMQEIIEANTTADTVKLNFRKFDGTIITQFIDFKNEIQIFKAVVLGELDRQEPAYQTFCFVIPFTNEFISSDAMSKLRQKNSDAIRHPEEERELEQLHLDTQLPGSVAEQLSPHINPQCRGAGANILANQTHVTKLLTAGSRRPDVPAPSLRRLSVEGLPACSSAVYTPELRTRPCACALEVCVAWYPCGLKYCRGKDSAGKTVSYRCGIKTCNKCRRFVFQAASSALCRWDQDYTDYFNYIRG